MTINEFLKLSPLYNCLASEAIVGVIFRERIEKITKVIIWIAIFLLLFVYFFQFNGSESRLIMLFIPRLWGMVCINISVLLFSKLADYYCSSEYYFEKIVNNTYEKNELYTFSAGRILYESRNSDILHGFIDSEIGRKTLQRLGIKKIDIKTFYRSSKISPEQSIPKSEGDYLKVQDIGKYLYTSIPNFSKFLMLMNKSEMAFFNALTIEVNQLEDEEYKRQWWRKEKLLEIKPLLKR